MGEVNYAITREWVRIRTAPSLDAEIAGYTVRGMTVWLDTNTTYDGSGITWYFITGETLTGYVSKDHLDGHLEPIQPPNENDIPPEVVTEIRLELAETNRRVDEMERRLNEALPKFDQLLLNIHAIKSILGGYVDTNT